MRHGCINGAVVFLALALPLAVVAAPPVITAPERTFAETGDWCFFVVSHDGKGLEAVPLDPGLTRFPSEKLKDANELGFRAIRPGSYRVLIYTGNAEGPSKPRVVVLIFGEKPPDGKPADPPPSDPPTPKAPDPLYFMVVHANGTDPPALDSPAWKTLRAAGHSFKARTVAQAAGLGVTLPAPTQLPCVVTLRVNPDGKSSTIVREAVPLPTTDTGILELPKGVK